ncbi:hypothetical protein [Spongiimicrobium sp. 3-5]|uniref:hypothetical protein n=1 Tax=Spongiimicrobium sp. 3-5 TaxID=3332596 RepID=UPI003980DC2C
MKKGIVIIIGSMMTFLIACNDKPDNDKSGNSLQSEQSANLTPLQVVSKRMKLYNEHNYDEFIKLYHKDVEVFTYPNRLMGTGADRLGSIFKSDFEKKSITVEIVNQMTNGSYVINDEIVTQNDKETKYVSIYKVKNGLIVNVSFVREF